MRTWSFLFIVCVTTEVPPGQGRNYVESPEAGLPPGFFDAQKFRLYASSVVVHPPLTENGINVPAFYRETFGQPPPAYHTIIQRNGFLNLQAGVDHLFGHCYMTRASGSTITTLNEGEVDMTQIPSPNLDFCIQHGLSLLLGYSTVDFKRPRKQHTKQSVGPIPLASPKRIGRPSTRRDREISIYNGLVEYNTLNSEKDYATDQPLSPLLQRRHLQPQTSPSAEAATPTTSPGTPSPTTNQPIPSAPKKASQ